MRTSFVEAFRHLKTFERKMLWTVASTPQQPYDHTLSYTIPLSQFKLDKLNPSDITEQLKDLTQKTVALSHQEDTVHVPWLTSVSYNDHKKTVTVTYNSLLKPFYRELKNSDHDIIVNA